MAARIVKVEPFDLVVFGGTGDLAYRKLYPALMNREKSEQFSEPTRIIGVSRRHYDRNAFRTFAMDLATRERGYGLIKAGVYDMKADAGRQQAAAVPRRRGIQAGDRLLDVEPDVRRAQARDERDDLPTGHC